MRLCKKGQGATEYLLMLAAVLVIVAIAVWYIMGMAPTAFISGTATLGTDNVTFTPDSRMIPSPIPTADWRYRILDENKATIYPAAGWAAGVEDLVIGEDTTMTATDVVRNYYLRIQYKEADFWDFQIV